MNSRQKGKRGELEFVKFLKDHGCVARRTAQYCGNTGEAADVVSDLPFHVEVKRVERLNINEAMKQAVRDCSNFDKIPVVAHRKSREEWLITMKATDFIDLVRGSAWTRYTKGQDES